MITSTNFVANGVYVDSGIIVIVDKDHFIKYNGTLPKSHLFIKKNFAPGEYYLTWKIKNTWNGMIQGGCSIKITSGTLYVTDPCYHIQNHDLWRKWLDENKQEVKDGVYIDSMGGDGLYKVEIELKPIKITNTKQTKIKKESKTMESTSKMKRISNLQAYILIKNTKSKIFSVMFKKTDGSIRKMNCRLGVSKYVTGKGMSWKPEMREMISVFDLQANDYRMINLATLMALTIDKQEYLVGNTMLNDYLVAKAKLNAVKPKSSKKAVKWTANDVIARAKDIAKLLNDTKVPN